MARLREFSLDDYERVYALWQIAGPGMGLGRSDSREEIQKKVQHDPDLFLVAEEDGRIVGTVIGGFDGRRGIVYHLAVDAAYRHRGIGRTLMAEIERRLAAKGCLRCYLLVRREMPELLDYYLQSGWEEMDLHLLAKNIA